MSISSSSQLLQEGHFHLNKKDLPKAFHLFLDSIEKAVADLRLEPSYALVTTAKEALNKAEDILNELAKTEVKAEKLVTLPMFSPTNQKCNRLEIPISPLSKRLWKHQNQLHEAQMKYDLSLQKSPPEDLKVLRDLIQVIDVEQIYCTRLQGAIDQVSSLSIDYYDVHHFSSHISYYAKLLWNGIVPKQVLISSLEKLPISVIRFLSFQEYLYSFLSLICENSQESNKSALADFIIQWAFQSLYVQHDLATLNTLADIIETQKALIDACNPQVKPILRKIQLVYGERTLDIQEELTNDMIAAHPIKDYNSVIVPNLSIFIKAGIEIYKTNPLGDSEAKFLNRFEKLLTSAQFEDVCSDTTFGLDLNESLQHWILSRDVSEKHCRPFWSDVCAHRPAVDVSVEMPTCGNLAPPSESVKSESEIAPKEIAPLVVDDDEISKELQRRLAALQSRKK